ncbi:MAG: hypothetical protein QF464_05480 [Myxococcota bacterium]|jgi:hypothetical protein|nr:hypothetical protein [Myxococcota bacterium]
MKPTSPPPAGHSPSTGAATEALLSLGLKPVARELHDVDRVDEATSRWRAMGYCTATGEPVREDVDTAAMFVDVQQVHTTRHLATHPVIERLVALGGGPMKRVLLDPSSRVHQWLAERLDAERAPHQGPRPSGARLRQRCAVYISRDADLAERARTLDRMAEASREADSAVELGGLLGYPDCCIEAFCALPQRWPNRHPIVAAMARTKTFEPRLNNVALDRFAWIAWFPCRYDCEASLGIADAAAASLDEAIPDQVVAADAALGQPRLYLDDRRQAALQGASREGDRVTFERLIPLDRPGQDPDPIWRSIADANSLRIEDGVATFYRGDTVLAWDGAPLFLPFGLP